MYINSFFKSTTHKIYIIYLFIYLCVSLCLTCLNNNNKNNNKTIKLFKELLENNIQGKKQMLTKYEFNDNSKREYEDKSRKNKSFLL